MNTRIDAVSPVSVVRHEAWTYAKNTSREVTVGVVAHRRADGTFAGGRFGNGARTGSKANGAARFGS